MWHLLFKLLSTINNNNKESGREREKKNIIKKKSIMSWCISQKTRINIHLLHPTGNQLLSEHWTGVHYTLSNLKMQYSSLV